MDETLGCSLSDLKFGSRVARSFSKFVPRILNLHMVFDFHLVKQLNDLNELISWFNLNYGGRIGV